MGTGELGPQFFSLLEGSIMKQTISPFLWFDNQAEEAAQFYVSVFKNSRIVKVTRYGDAGPGPKGSAMFVGFELDGQTFSALNGGPLFSSARLSRSSSTARRRKKWTSSGPS